MIVVVVSVVSNDSGSSISCIAIVIDTRVLPRGVVVPRVALRLAYWYQRYSAAATFTAAPAAPLSLLLRLLLLLLPFPVLLILLLCCPLNYSRDCASNMQWLDPLLNTALAPSAQTYIQ